MNIDNQTLLMAFIAVTGLAVLLQAFILLAIYLAIRKAARSVSEQAEALRASIMPVIDSTREVVQRVTPRIEGAVNDLADIAQSLKKQSAEAQGTLSETLNQVKKHSARVDAMLTALLNNVDRASRFVNETVARPVRQFNGILAGVRAVVETLRRPAAPHHAAEQEKRG
jgi:ABC-type transporter Mla subunit MlaD